MPCPASSGGTPCTGCPGTCEERNGPTGDTPAGQTAPLNAGIVNKPNPGGGVYPKPNPGGSGTIKPNPGGGTKSSPSSSVNISINPVIVGGGGSIPPVDGGGGGSSLGGGGSGGGGWLPADVGGGMSGPPVDVPPVAVLTSGSTLPSAGISASNYPPPVATVQQTERYLKVRNNTGERLRVYVQHYSLTAGGEWA